MFDVVQRRIRDDPDYPAYTTGRAAEVLGVGQACPRSLDAAGAVCPQRSAGGCRRYTRRQLDYAVRIRALSGQGHTPGRDAADPGPGKRPAAERTLTARLHRQLGEPGAPGG